MKVSHILEKRGAESYCVDVEQNLAEAVVLMASKRIGSVVVMNAGVLVSIVTERDVLMAVARQSDLAKVAIKDVMAPKLIVCAVDASIDEAMDLMINNETGRRIRHLPVMDADKFVGVISIGDVVEVLLTKTEFENKLLKSYIQNWPDE